jgi:hypothetical protein
MEHLIYNILMGIVFLLILCAALPTAHRSIRFIRIHSPSVL